MTDEPTRCADNIGNSDSLLVTYYYRDFLPSWPVLPFLAEAFIADYDAL